jgi:hypothetical protein
MISSNKDKNTTVKTKTSPFCLAKSAFTFYLKEGTPPGAGGSCL